MNISALRWRFTRAVRASIAKSLYVHIQREIRACSWGQNNSPALHLTVFIRRLLLRELLWSAGTHGKALPSNDERRARRLVQRDGSPYAFYERNYFDVQAIEESMRRRKSHNEKYFL